ncbi:MAG: membrane protein insertase YidC [Clostridia bacterium]|nr:membrane protein insertase YidC [Clostridia bacterium]
MLRWFESWTGNYIWALLIFEVIVEILFLPFGIKQQKNQIKQAKLRPKEMAIRNKYKGRDDQVTRQKMQQEIQEFYQKENFNPASGCLPLLIQLPIILALYNIVIDPLKYVVGFTTEQIQAIATIIEKNVENAKMTVGQTIPFITQMKDLCDGSYDKLVEIFGSVEGFTEKVPSLDVLPNFNIFGNVNLGLIPSKDGVSWLLIVPVLVFAIQFASTKLMRKFTYQAPAAQDANMGCSNTVMDITMPLMTAYFAYTFPAAIGIYWTAKNVLSSLKQFILSKIMPMPVFTEEDYKAAEKELSAKQPKKKSGANGISSSGKPVRSLHHIDDEDFEDTREKALERKRLIEEAEAEEKRRAEKAKDKSVSPAPLKEDKKNKDNK